MAITVTLKGLKALNKKFNSIIDEIPEIVAEEYKKDIVKNLQESKKSGKLSKSFIIMGKKNRTKIVSKLPYAEIQNFGGKIRITARMRKKMWALYEEFGLGVYKAIALTKKAFITIPAKNYIDVNLKNLYRRADRKLKKKLDKI